MQAPPAQQPLAAAAVTLVTWIACIAAFLPPLNQYTLHSVPLMILAGMGIAVSMVLHLTFVGIAAKRLQRSPALWVVIALVGFPVASVIGLILCEWLNNENRQTAG